MLYTLIQGEIIIIFIHSNTMDWVWAFNQNGAVNI